MKKILFVLFAVIMMVGCFAVSGSAVLDIPWCSEGGTEKINFLPSYDATKYTSAYVCTKRVSKGSNGYSSTVTYTYNSKGFPTKRAEEDLVHTYVYDNKGNLTKKAEKWGFDDTPTYYIYTYNDKGNVAREVIKWSEDDKDTTKYTYDSNGNLGAKYYDATFTYNSKGLMTKENYYGDIITCSYNSKNLLTKQTIKSSEGHYYTYSYTYNAKGNPIKEVYKNSDGYTDTTSYTYDSKGNRTKEVYKDSDGETTTYTYTYKKITTKSPVIAGKIHIQYATAKYTGSAKKPNVTVDGLKKGIDYRITYSNNVNPGTAKAKITFLGEYATQQPVTIKYKITMDKVTVTSAAMKSGTYNASVKWSKVTGAKKYEVYAYNFGDKKYVKVADTTSTSYSGTWTGWDTVKLKIRAVNGSYKGAFSDVVTLKHKA